MILITTHRFLIVYSDIILQKYVFFFSCKKFCTGCGPFQSRLGGCFLYIEMSICLFVCLFVCLSVCLFTFEVPFNGLFDPTSRSLISKKINKIFSDALYIMLILGIIFKALALWADAFYKSKCPYICLSVCLFVCLSVHF